MKEVLVWVLVTAGSGNNFSTKRVDYSPPMNDIHSCLRLKEAVQKASYYEVRAKCVQIRMVVSKI